MALIKKQKNKIPELRQDLVTKEWVVIAEKRAKRPQEFTRKDLKPLDTSLENCPFENPQKYGNGEPLLLYKNKKYPDWSLQVIPNLYPIFTPDGKCGETKKVGPYSLIDSAGLHEVIITRDHSRHLAIMEDSEVEEVMRAYRERYLAIKNQKEGCVKYISIFHNHGPEAGASISHPHSQLVATPIIPTDVGRSIKASYSFYGFNKTCVHCAIISWEKESKKRVLFENDNFIAFCPFVSRVNFEIQIFPKEHKPNFEETSINKLGDLADVLKKSLKVLYDVLKNPSYNFFIHTAPIDTTQYKRYHWHIEIFPKTNTWAGIELGTGIEVLMISPENAAKYLQKNI